jgi:hypothetical protein
MGVEGVVFLTICFELPQVVVSEYSARIRNYLSALPDLESIVLMGDYCVTLCVAKFDNFSKIV